MSVSTAPDGTERSSDVALRDGSTVRIRTVRPSDVDEIRAFLKGLSQESRYFRFFSGAANLDRAAEWAADVDLRDRYGIVATSGHRGTVIAHAAYTGIGDRQAEFALEVADEFHGLGIGTIMLGQLAEAAADSGIEEFRAEALPSNHAVIEMLRTSGFPIRLRSEPGLVVVEIPVALTPEALGRFERRDQISAVAALTHFLAPRSVAVVGASRRRGSIGGEVFHNLLAAEFNGPVYPINPNAGVIQSVVAYPTVLDVPGDVDLAVIVVPAPAVEAAARECAEKGVRCLVVISAGFGETDAAGRERQRALLEICRESGMRMIGPNCMGIINTAPGVRLDATFAPTFPPRGRVGFLSQSGALGLAVIDHANALGLGLSSFVSSGNKADISGNDLLHYWESDDDTDLILLYLESFGNPRTFSRIGRRIGRTKPIVAVKSGRSTAGARATASHTGALLAASDVTVDALFRQCGIIRTDTLSQMFDVASLLANQPVPVGPRVAIVTNAGGPGILCADACEARGLVTVDLPDDVRDKLAAFLPPEAATRNPVDMIASASADDYRRAIDLLASCPAIDALIVIFIPPLVTKAEDVAAAIRTAAEGLTRPIPLLTVFMSAQGVPGELRSDTVSIPSYAFPEDAAEALALATRYGAWKATPEGRIVSFPDARHYDAAAVISRALVDGARWLTPQETFALLSCYGIPVADTRFASTPADAGRAAKALGGAVALKAIAADVVHKTEAGAVRLGLEGPTRTQHAARAMRDALAEEGHTIAGFVVQAMAEPGVEMIVGVVHDPSFGPVVAVGAGGTAVELLKDVRVGITPLTDVDAHEMIRSLATFPLLDGFRGAPKMDAAALEDMLARVSALVEAHREIAEMDLNPVIVHEHGALAVDARIRVDAPPPQLAIGARRPG